MSSNFRKPTFSSSQKHCLGSVSGIIRSSSPPSDPHQRSQVHKNKTPKKQISKPLIRMATEGNEYSQSKYLLEKYKLNKLDPIAAEYSEKKMKRLEQLMKNEEKVIQKVKKEKLRIFLENPDEMISKWKNEDVSERKNFSKRLKMATLQDHKSSKKLNMQLKSKSLLRNTFHQKSNNHPLTSLLSESPKSNLKKSLMDGSIPIFERSQPKLKTLRTVQADIYKHHIQELLEAMEKNRKKLKKEKNKLIRSIREEKQLAVKQEREQLYQFLQKEIQEQRVKSREKDDFRLFLEEPQAMTFQRKMVKQNNSNEENQVQGAQKQEKPEEKQKSTLKIRIKDLQELISSRIKHQSEVNPQEREEGEKQMHSRLIQPKILSPDFNSENLLENTPVQLPKDDPHNLPEPKF